MGRRSVHVACCVFEFVVDMKCGEEVVLAYRGVNEDVVVEFGVQ